MMDFTNAEPSAVDAPRPASSLRLALLALTPPVVALALIWSVWNFWPRPLREAGPFPEPLQTPVAGKMALRAPDGYIITALYEYRVEAMVMSRQRYRWDATSDLSPLDLLLAWGPVTREPNLSGIEWSQNSRFGFFQFQYKDVTLSEKAIGRHSANTHIIPPPDDPHLRRQLLGLRRGDCVQLDGYLVRAFLRDGGKWQSSKTRTDTGNGACEIFYVTSLERI